MRCGSRSPTSSCASSGSPSRCSSRWSGPTTSGSRDLAMDRHVGDRARARPRGRAGRSFDPTADLGAGNPTDLLATQAASGRTWDIHVGHMAERHALFVIIAIGESLIVAGTAVAAHERTPALVADPALALLIACLLWWTYFGWFKEALEEQLEDTAPGAIGARVRDAYSLGHSRCCSGSSGSRWASRRSWPIPATRSTATCSSRWALASRCSSALGGRLLADFGHDPRRSGRCHARHGRRARIGQLAAPGVLAVVAIALTAVVAWEFRGRLQVSPSSKTLQSPDRADRRACPGDCRAGDDDWRTGSDRQWQAARDARRANDRPSVRSRDPSGIMPAARTGWGSRARTSSPSANRIGPRSRPRARRAFPAVARSARRSPRSSPWPARGLVGAATVGGQVE